MLRISLRIIVQSQLGIIFISSAEKVILFGYISKKLIIYFLNAISTACPKPNKIDVANFKAYLNEIEVIKVLHWVDGITIFHHGHRSGHSWDRIL